MFVCWYTEEMYRRRVVYNVVLFFRYVAIIWIFFLNFIHEHVIPETRDDGEHAEQT